MTKTENYQLSQWEVTDKLCRTDFNEDNAKIEEALSSVYSAKNAPWEMGSFDISSAAVGNVIKTFDFEPKAVFLFSATAHTGGGCNGSNIWVNSVVVSGNYRQFRLSGNTLTLQATNGAIGTTLEYLALK